jgi:hypothetical protein
VSRRAHLNGFATGAARVSNFIFVWFPPSPATARQACISWFTILPF